MNDAASQHSLTEYLDVPIHLFVYHPAFRDQLKLILSVLKFTNITPFPVQNSYMKSVQELATLLRKENDALILVEPPLEIYDVQTQSKTSRELNEFFRDVSLILEKHNKDVFKTLSMCVPVFEDIQFIHKREATLLTLAEFGVSGAFILQKQEPLIGMSKQRHQAMQKQQLMERLAELKKYMEEYLPYRKGNLEDLMVKWEEKKLSDRKAEAEEYMKQADACKKANDWDRAIQCYKKAIDLYPADPRAYLENGRVYVRINKYPHALQRFRQAEEVAENLPEPNKEIGKVRVLQVRERLACGEPPDSPEITRLMDDAAANFGKALIKAEEVQHTNGQDSQEKNINAVMEIAGDIIKLDIASTLGKDHPAAQKLGNMAKDSLLLVKGKDISELPAKQLLFMGHAAMDSGDFESAEQHFYKASEKEEFFSQACNEIIYMGHYVRRREGPEAAIGVYERLLSHEPPHKEAVFFNLAVASAAAKQNGRAAQALCRCLFLEPELAEDDMFYRSPLLFPVMRFVLNLYEHLADTSNQNEASKAELQAGIVQEKLLVLFMSKNTKGALQLIMQAAAKLPGFFKREALLADNTLCAFLQNLGTMCVGSANPKLKKLGKYILAATRQKENTELDEELIEFRASVSKILATLIKTKEKDVAAGLMTEAAFEHPDLFSAPEFFGNRHLVAFAKEVYEKFGKVDPERLQ